MSDQKKRGLGDNSKNNFAVPVTAYPNDYEYSYIRLERAYHRLKDLVCDRIGLMIDLQSHDLEDARRLAKEKQEDVQEIIRTLSKTAYKSTKPEGPHNDKKISYYDALKVKDVLPEEIASLELENVKIQGRDDE